MFARIRTRLAVLYAGLFALALALVATLGLGARWLLVAALVAALLAIPPGAIKGSEAGKVIYETETEYQYAQVVQLPDGVRHLELNEGQAIHSSYHPGSYLTGGYWDGLLVDPIAALPAPPRRVAMLGTAAGTTARAYGRYFPDTRVDAVEIDRELLDIGRRYFDLRPRPQLRTIAEDARPFLRQTPYRYDVIMVDAYRQPYIPFYLTTQEFFSLARDRLARGGVVAINVGHPEGSDRLERVLSATLRSVFAHVARDPLDPTNTILMASDAPITRERFVASGDAMPADLRPLALRASARLRPGLPGGTVYTDDRAPVEWLVDKSILNYAENDGR